MRGRMSLSTARALLEKAGKLTPDVIAVKVGTKVVDLFTPVDEAAELAALTSTDAAGLDVIRHSTAHVMADAVQRLFPGTKVTIGPSTEDGFYYDFDRKEGAFTEDDLAKIEGEMRAIIAKDSAFRRDEVSRDEARELFAKMGESYKLEILDRIGAGERISLYRHGEPGKEWVDLCAGPHVPSTKFLAAVKLTSVAGAYWRGDERNPMLQRIYGTAFPSQQALDEHLKALEEAKARDHRKLGKELELFHFDPVAPAMPFFLPKGTRVYNGLVDFVRKLYDRDGYEEVITPQVFSPKLFETSGHLANYGDNLYRTWTTDQFELPVHGDGHSAATLQKELEANSFALKPMNCPSHCVIFGSKLRSYRELPWRVADFGRLHRYERGGVVHGLSRVRTFCQDDAHIFCAEEQVAGEIEKFIGMLREVYDAFQFSDVNIKLATRPEKRLGSDDEWDRSEGALKEGLERAGLPFEITPGEGAFYGPKIEFHVKDALKRSWQLGTIQFDPNLPQRFDLGFVGDDGKQHRPVMLHRAILGSLERFFSVLLEHCAGAFPTWLAPVQVRVLTVSEKSNAYALQVLGEMKARGLRVEADLGPEKLGAKVREGRMSRVPYLVVVGPKDAEAGTVSARSRDAGELGAMTLEAFLGRVLPEATPPVQKK
jgi:threonyl-tRNA synthetase